MNAKAFTQTRRGWTQVGAGGEGVYVLGEGPVGFHFLRFGKSPMEQRKGPLTFAWIQKVF